MVRLDGKVVVVTGASAGIGRATARLFARQGARVALLARGIEGLNGALREIVEAGGHGLAIPTDVAVAEQVERAAERVERELGAIDIWVNSAMATLFSPLIEITPEEFRRVTEVTYLGTVYGTLAALKRMSPRNRGAIVQVGSALAYRSIPLQAPYCGAKAAIRGFTDSLRSELLHDRLDIHVTMVQLAAFNTPQFDWARNRTGHRAQPVPPIFQPEEAAEGIFYAATHRRREVWVGWPAVKAIVANKFFPGVIDRLLAKRGYTGQMTAERDEPGRPDNLFTPVGGDHGAHGRFDAIAKPRSRELQLSTHRRLAALAATSLGIALLSRRRERRPPAAPRRPDGR